MNLKKIASMISRHEGVLCSVASIALGGIMLDKMSLFCGEGGITAIFATELATIDNSLDIGIDTLGNAVKLIIAYSGLRLVYLIKGVELRDYLVRVFETQDKEVEIAITKQKPDR